MQKIFEKIIERFRSEVNYNDGAEIGLKQSIEIVNQEADQYNNGWIPCEIEMPKEHDSIFARYKGTDRWNNGMFEKVSDEVNVTAIDNKGNRSVTHARVIDGEWSCYLMRDNRSHRIIAWQPLPEPYHQKGE